jgi:hypothetical protein
MPNLSNALAHYAEALAVEERSYNWGNAIAVKSAVFLFMNGVPTFSDFLNILFAEVTRLTFG